MGLQTNDRARTGASAVLLTLGLALAAAAGLAPATPPRSAAAARPGPAAARAEARLQTTPGTPIVDPIQTPAPAFLPLTLRRFDPRLPEALVSTLEGYITSLNRDGRRTCAPASHVLLSAPEGSPKAAVVAAIYSSRPDLELDFYINLCVQVSGPISLASTPCQAALTWQLMDVSTIKDKGICTAAARRVRPSGIRHGAARD